MNAADMLADIAQDHAELTAIRRDIHAHPEMGLEEVRTAALVAAKLRDWGVEVTEGVGITGVVGVIRGTRPIGPSNRERAIGLRADMDALAIPEQTGVDYASQNAGVRAGMTGTRRCCWGRRSIWRAIAILPER